MNARCTNLFAALLVLAASTNGADQTNSPSASALAELTKPAKKIPFKEVILATTHHRVLDFDTNSAAHVALVKKIQKAAANAAASATTNGLLAARANEAGNHMEAFVKRALYDAGLPARTPVTSAGNAQETGYPDVEITGDVPCYLELKTYNATTVNPLSGRFTTHRLSIRRSRATRCISYSPTSWKNPSATANPSSFPSTGNS